MDLYEFMDEELEVDPLFATYHYSELGNRLAALGIQRCLDGLSFRARAVDRTGRGEAGVDPAPNSCS